MGMAYQAIKPSNPANDNIAKTTSNSIGASAKPDSPGAPNGEIRTSTGSLCFT